MADPTSSKKGRIVSGMRPTGKPHLGNYVGALRNWVNLQDDYDCFFFIADWHALTTDYANTSDVKPNSLEVMIDYLAAGLDPERSTLFIQSHVPQHAELYLLFGMITPLGWLERVPTYKEQRENINDKDLSTYGFLGYPLLQSADILMYKADFVPVGEDQVPHVELTREVARRFNQFYPRKVGAGSRPETLTGLPGTQAIADPRRKAAWHRRSQDVEVLWQYNIAQRAGSVAALETQDHGDRPSTRSSQRSRQSRRLPRR